MTELRSLSEFCNFGSTLEDMIRDCLVCGINDEAMQKCLLAEPKLTYKRAVELAQSLEWADKNVKELKPKIKGTLGSATPQDVHYVTEQCTCYRCGKAGHLASRCRVDKDVIYHKCKKPGHLPKSLQHSAQQVTTEVEEVIVVIVVSQEQV